VQSLPMRPDPGHNKQLNPNRRSKFKGWDMNRFCDVDVAPCAHNGQHICARASGQHNRCNYARNIVDHCGEQ
jgi:hypothetical protein